MAGLCKGPLEVCGRKFKVRQSTWSCVFLLCGVGKELEFCQRAEKWKDDIKGRLSGEAWS